ncbi:S-layer homology domain-containing protein [Ezakiella peruensis]|uniref:S-layer homology domain-containing protein n=1 Tax=Ezakiella peruensis TaxID=1464038 RepID=UPI00147339E1|nr:S-layer homology domain-containing protein [Ezakiella peruensis]
MKKFLCIAIALLMVLALLPAGIYAEEPTEEEKAKENLEFAINDAKKAKDEAKVIDDKTEAEVEKGIKFVTSAEMKALTDEISDAEAVKDAEGKTADELNSETFNLINATSTFRAKIKTGTKEEVKPEPKPEPKPENKTTTLTIYLNYSTSDSSTTSKTLLNGSTLADVDLSRDGYRLNGFSYSSSGSLLSSSTKVEDVVSALFAQWTYVGYPSTPRYRNYGYYRPASLEYTMDKAKAFKNSYPTQIANASYAARTEFNSAYSDVADMYNNKYWGYYDGRYNDGYYYGDRVYYRNGNWYTFDEYVSRYGTYDMENYRRYGYYGDYYDGYYEDLYERNGKVYSYSDYYRTFGRYPYESERLKYRDGYGYWDPYYGWTYDGYYNGYYDYYGSNYRARLERLIDAIRAIAREYPTNSSIYINYSGLAYPSYSSDYYYGYDYYGYNGLTSSQVKNMRDLISKAEKVRGEVKGNVDKQIVNNLQAAIDDGYRALRGRSSYSTAYNNLEAAINAADLVDNTIYIRSAYMQGTSNGNFGPNEQLTRAQVAQIVANLLRQSGKTTVYNPKQYKDVEDYRWYKGAVDLVTSYGIMEGTPAGNFEPNRLVTKAELVVTAARLKNYQTTPGNVFGLTSHYWAQGYIQTAYVNGWLDTKNGFVPNAPITRAETVHIFNGALGYGPDQDYIIKYANQMNKFNDVTRGMDYYFDIITATNSISYKVKLNGNRVWLTHMQPNGIWAMPQYSAGGVAVNPLN